MKIQNSLKILIVYLIYLFLVRILLNIILASWLNANIPDNLLGIFIWGIIKIIHWALPLFIYLGFIKKNLKNYLKEKYFLKFPWMKVFLFVTGWGLLIIAQHGFKLSFNISAYSLINNVIITGIVEEFVFRGFVMDELEKIGKFSKANIFQSIFFSLNHLPWLYTLGIFNNPLLLFGRLIFYIFFGLIAGFITKKTKSIIPSTILHMINNLLTV